MGIFDKQKKGVIVPTVRKSDTRGYGKAIINDKIKSHAQDPFFIKKLEEAREAVSKITLPENNKK